MLPKTTIIIITESEVIIEISYKLSMYQMDYKYDDFNLHMTTEIIYLVKFIMMLLNGKLRA